jgi:hypothetical protein
VLLRSCPVPCRTRHRAHAHDQQSVAWPPAEHAHRGQSLYCGVKAGVPSSLRQEAALAIKAAASRPRARTPSPPRLARRCHRAPPPVHSRSQVTPLASFPCTTRAMRAACVAAAPLSSPEQQLQRPPPPGAAAGHHRSRPNPNFRHKPISGEPLTLLLPFPGRPRRRSRRILAGTATPMAQGPNCIPLLVYRVFCVNQGLGCEPEKLFRGVFES